jgi:hypothetical protein
VSTNANGPDDPQNPGEIPPPQPAAAGNGDIMGRLVEASIEDELKDSYLTYAMSVIVSRALPDVRDGLKPSQRRILVAMNDLGLSPGGSTSKCAGIVGETMKRYHPHGDAAIYPTLVRMGQEWSTRYLLIDKQGNFGSIAGLPPAQMRYTEARLSNVSVEMLADYKLDTVDFVPNYDEKLTEPRCCRRSFRICWSTARRGSPSAWRRAFRRTTWWRCAMRWSRSSTIPNFRSTRSWRSCPGPIFPPAA